jgi:hypothetical protein
MTKIDTRNKRPDEKDFCKEEYDFQFKTNRLKISAQRKNGIDSIAIAVNCSRIDFPR